MSKLFIPYILAEKAKDKGFTEDCIGYWWDKAWMKINNKEVKETHHICLPSNHNRLPTRVSSILYQQLLDWFREKYHYHISITFKEVNGWKIEGINYVPFDIEIYLLQGGDAIKTYKFEGYSPDFYKCLDKAFEEAFKLI